MSTIPTYGRRPWYEALEQGEELELWVHAPTWPELVAQAGRALGEQLLRGAPAPVSGRWRDLRVQSGDRITLLADWLNDLLFHAEAEWWIPVEFTIVRASDTEIHARARGVAVREPPAAFRGAAPDHVRVRDVPGGLEAKVTLEVP